MGHHHHHHSGSALGFAFVINFVFSIIELIGGWLTNSVAIMSDGIHDLGDSVALALTWYFEKIAARPSTRAYTYGYQRFSVMAALISSLVLLVGSTLVLKEAVPRLWQAPEVHTPGMIAIACLGLVVNGLAFFRLHPDNSSGEKAVRLHLLEDVLGWVAVLLGAIVIYFTGWFWLDPVLSIAVALFILWNVVKNVYGFARIVLQAAPEDIDLAVLTQELEQLEQVHSIHDLHLWTLDSNKHVLSVHLVLHQNTSLAEGVKVKHRAKKIIRGHGIQHDTLELETREENCEFQAC